MSKFLSSVLLFGLACQCASADETTTNTLTQISTVNKSKETVNVGNALTNNLNHIEANYQPSQTNQFVIQFGKFAKDARKLRKTRPPTLEEFAVKQRILEVSEAAQAEGAQGKSRPYLDHLGRILRALNPKYIATERVMRAAFADPMNPSAEVVAPERDYEKRYESFLSELPPTKLQLDSAEAVEPQLDELARKFYATVSWDKQFVKQLFKHNDRDMTAKRLAFKRLLQCLTYELSCYGPAARGTQRSEVVGTTRKFARRAPAVTRQRALVEANHKEDQFEGTNSPTSNEPVESRGRDHRLGEQDEDDQVDQEEEDQGNHEIEGQREQQQRLLQQSRQRENYLQQLSQYAGRQEVPQFPAPRPAPQPYEAWGRSYRPDYRVASQYQPPYGYQQRQQQPPSNEGPHSRAEPLGRDFTQRFPQRVAPDYGRLRQ